MANTIAAKNTNVANLIGHALLIIPSAVLFSSTLGFTPSANASGFPELEQRGSHGANHIVHPAKSTTQKLQSIPQANVQDPQQPVQAARKFPILVQRGPHGANHIVTQEGVGGPTGEYKGFPQLERYGSRGGFRIVSPSRR